MSDTTKIDKQISDLEAQLNKLKAEKNAIESMTLEQRIALVMHEKLCNWNHTDGCDWHYDTGNWLKYARVDYLKRARFLITLIRTINKPFDDNDLYSIAYKMISTISGK